MTFVATQVAKAQLDEDLCVDAIASYIKAEDPSYYNEVSEAPVKYDCAGAMLWGLFVLVYS